MTCRRLRGFDHDKVALSIGAQGAVTPDEYQVCTPFLDRPGLVPILEKRLGAKER